MDAEMAVAGSQLRRPHLSEVTWISYRSKPKFYDYIRPEDWIIRTMTSDGRKYVYPPAQLIRKTQWVSSRSALYDLLLLESSRDEQAYPWKRFMQLAKETGTGFSNRRVVSHPVQDLQQARELETLWTDTGSRRY